MTTAPPPPPPHPLIEVCAAAMAAGAAHDTWQEAREHLADEVRRAYTAGMTVADLARETGETRLAVHAWIDGWEDDA